MRPNPPSSEQMVAMPQSRLTEDHDDEDLAVSELAKLAVRPAITVIVTSATALGLLAERIWPEQDYPAYVRLALRAWATWCEWDTTIPADTEIDQVAHQLGCALVHVVGEVSADELPITARIAMAYYSSWAPHGVWPEYRPTTTSSEPRGSIRR